MNSAAAQPHLRIERVTKRFAAAAAPAVAAVSLDVAAGDFFALLGPSGCGKTTLLRLLAGLEQPDEGQILIGGEDMAGVPPYRRPVNMMFQSYALFPHMSVAENVAFGLKQERRPKPEIARRVATMLDLVQMGRLAERRPAQLSGGERQRVALARALVKEPKLLLLDEPLTALDRKLREETREELVRIHAQVGITFLMVTHDQEEAMSMASKVAVMQAGRIAQLGSPREVYEAPASRFVADFVGAVNVFPGRAGVRADGLLQVETAWGTLWVAHDGPVAPGRSVAVAVRPEKVALLSEADAAAAMLRGRIESIAYRGETSTYRVALDDETVMRVTLPNRARSTVPFAPGDAVGLAWDPAAAFLLET